MNKPTFIFYFSKDAIALIVFIKESGVGEMLSIPFSTRNWAKSGKSEGPSGGLATKKTNYFLLSFSGKSANKRYIHVMGIPTKTV